LSNEPTKNFKTINASKVEKMNSTFIIVTMRENNNETVKDIYKKISKTAFGFIWNNGKLFALTNLVGYKDYFASCRNCQ